MRSAHVVWLGLLALTLTGCLRDRTSKSSSWLDRFRQLGGPSGPDAVYIDYALVERPAGDFRLNREVWSQADEQVLPVETRAVVEENGFRVGVVGGLVPSEVESLWRNPKSSMGRRERRLYAGKDAALTLNGPLPECRFQIFTPASTGPNVVTLEQANCSLVLIPTMADGGKVRVRFAPEVQHHDKKHWVPAGAVGAGWINGAKPVERYPELGWELTLSPSEYVVIGTLFERDETLGYQFFMGPAAKNRVQRLLLVKAGRVSGPPAGDITLDDEQTEPSKGKPLALQASYTTVRGARP
jgi:hypothetical protein